MDVRTDPLKIGMGGVALMVEAPSATIWGVIALPKRVARVGVIMLQRNRLHQLAPKEWSLHDTWWNSNLQTSWMYMAFISVQNVQTSSQKLNCLGLLEFEDKEPHRRFPASQQMNSAAS